MTLVGYSDYHKAYRSIDPSNDKVVISRDARFLEGEKPPKHSIKPTDVIEIESPLPRGSQSVTEPDHQTDDVDVDSDAVYESGEESFHEEPIVPPTPVRISERTTKGIPPARFRETSSLAHNLPPEPRTYDEAINGP
nr:uncharacterized protein LOC115258487 [Aedes albopictus]